MLNRGLRPFLSKWHPELQEWEAKNTTGMSAKVHEQEWDKEPALREELKALRQELAVYAHALAVIAGVEE
ncbi:MAG: hypothetical protein VKL42_17490 [Snowella sp.]|nr:hypothetical protein [Snowella sp.]